MNGPETLSRFAVACLGVGGAVFWAGVARWQAGRGDAEKEAASRANSGCWVLIAVLAVLT